MEFIGRSALVSGGAGGLGGATARRLVELGMGVVIFEPDADRAEAFAHALGPKAIGLAGDHNDEAAVELAIAGRPALAAVDLFIVVQANMAMPLAIHSLLRALRGDLVHALSDANHDPLTGLLNRRAFRTQTLNLFDRPGDARHLVVALIDLDKFKALNDTHGHHVGDQALVAVADTLRATATSSAVSPRCRSNARACRAWPSTTA